MPPENITLDTVVAPGEITLRDVLDLTLSNKWNLDELKKWASEKDFYLSPFVEPPSKTEEVGVRLDSEEIEGGFSIALILSNLHNVGHFTSFQADTEFPISTNFLQAGRGDIIIKFAFGFQAKDGHPKEGRV